MNFSYLKFWLGTASSDAYRSKFMNELDWQTANICWSLGDHSKYRNGEWKKVNVHTLRKVYVPKRVM